MIRIKESIKHHENQLERWLNYTDAVGKKGIGLISKDYEFVNGKEKADIGVSWHGAPVQGLPPKKCILMKNEPPIYNVFFGDNLSNEKFTGIYAAVMASHKINDNDIYYNIPRYEFKFVDKKNFESKKEEMICMILRHKKWSYRLNSINHKNRKFNRNSLLRYRERMDKFFNRSLGKMNYHSYGGPWTVPCYKGKIKDDGKWEVFNKYNFCFCPENSRFKGYVTEKLIQPMCFGAIPIYLGAHDVSEYVPNNLFIDAEKLSDEKLLKKLIDMQDYEFCNYRKKMYDFVTSNKSKCFSSVTFAGKLKSVLEDVV